MLKIVLVTGVTGAALLVAPAAAQAAPAIGPAVPVGGSATVTDPAAAYPSTVAVQLSTVTCTPKIALATTTGPWIPLVTARTGTSVTFTVPTGTGAGPNGTVKPYNTCIYDTAAGNSALLSSTTLYVGAPVSVSPVNGPTGGGNQITVTTKPDTPVFAAATSVAAAFTTGSCGATLGGSAPANLVATAVARQSGTSVSLTVPPGVVGSTGVSPTPYNLCLYDSSAAGGTLLTAGQYAANMAAVSPSAGSYLTSNAVVMSSPIPFLTGVPSPAVMLVTGSSCPAAPPTATATGPAPVTVAGTAVRRISSNRLVVNVPPLALTGNQATPYQICVYGGPPSGVLIGSGSYLAALTATPTSVTPSAGPAAGGSTITVLGTDFPTDPARITATLGGMPLTNIQVISDRAFTAQTPAHPVQDDVTLVVTTPMGTKTLTAAYSYLNPLKITPNTAPSTAGTVEIDVQGTGFLELPFGTGAVNAPRIYLVNGVYNGADAGDNPMGYPVANPVGTAGGKVNGPVSECVNVLPITDEELVCTLQLGRRFNANGSAFFDPAGYVNTLDGDVNATTGSRLVTSMQGRFSRNDVGQPVWTSMMPFLAPGTTIATVLSPSRALLSAPATMSGGNLSMTVGGQPLRNLGNVLTTTAGSNTVGLTSGAFTKADVGRVLGNTMGIAPGTAIVSIGAGGSTATISAPATASTAITLTGVSVADGSNLITSTTLTGNEMPAIVGANTLGIPVGTTLTSVTPGVNAMLSAPASGGGGPATLTLNRPVNAMIYANAPVPDGAYHLVIVSNGANDAAVNDPAYFQTNVTSSSTFTVAAF